MKLAHSFLAFLVAESIAPIAAADRLRSRSLQPTPPANDAYSTIQSLLELVFGPQPECQATPGGSPLVCEGTYGTYTFISTEDPNPLPLALKVCYKQQGQDYCMELEYDDADLTHAAAETETLLIDFLLDALYDECRSSYTTLDGLDDNDVLVIKQCTTSGPGPHTAAKLMTTQSSLSSNGLPLLLSVCDGDSEPCTTVEFASDAVTNMRQAYIAVVPL